MKRTCLFLALAAAVGLNGPRLAAQKIDPIKGELKRTDEKLKTFEKKQVHKVTLDEGKDYLIDMTSTDFDTLLRVLDANGTELATNDDGGAGNNARLVFTPKKAADYQLEATAFGERGGGKYEITVKAIKKTGQADVKKGKLEEKSPKFGSRYPYESIKLDLEKGKLYRLDLESKDFDPLLQVYHQKGNLIASDKDGGGAKSARLYFTPPETGSYDVRAMVQLNLKAGKDDKVSYGEFTLTVQPYEFAEK